MLKGFYPGCSVKLRNGHIAKNVYKTNDKREAWAYASFKKKPTEEELNCGRLGKSIPVNNNCHLAWYESGKISDAGNSPQDIIEILPKPKPKNPLKGYYPGCSVKLCDGHVVHNVYKTKSKDPGFRYAAFRDPPTQAGLAAVHYDVHYESLTAYNGWTLAWYNNGRLLDGCHDPCDIEEVLPKEAVTEPDRSTLIKGFYNGCSVELRDGSIVTNVWRTETNDSYGLVAFKCEPNLADLAKPDCSRAVKVHTDNYDLAWYVGGNMWSSKAYPADIMRVLPQDDKAVDAPKDYTLSEQVKKLEDELAKVKAQLAERDKCIDNFVQAIKAR